MLNFASLTGAMLAIVVIFALVLLVVLAFEVTMFISAVKNPNITNEAKILWLIGMVFIHPFVAIAYYFTDYKKV
jgi:hypothetical protein